MRLSYAAAWLLICGCGTAASYGGREIPSAPSVGEAGISWGGPIPVVSAVITDVKVECFPQQHVAVRRRGVQRDAFTDYQIDATAWVGCRVEDVQAFRRTSNPGYRATIVFEAVSASSVVIGSAEGSFRPVEGLQTTTVSARIPSLSEAKVQRVAYVIARWRYGE
jgi:hypothetical protein